MQENIKIFIINKIKKETFKLFKKKKFLLKKLQLFYIFQMNVSK